MKNPSKTQAVLGGFFENFPPWEIYFLDQCVDNDVANLVVISRRSFYNLFMDILAHTLWTNAAARGVNGLREKKVKPKVLNVGWTA